MVSRGVQFDGTGFLVGGHVEDIKVPLNGTIYFLLHQLTRLDIPCENLSTYSCSKIISSGDVLILMSLRNKVHAELSSTMANDGRSCHHCECK